MNPPKAKAIFSFSKKFFLFLLAGLFTLAVFAFLVLAFLFQPSSNEFYRVRSPNQMFDAVVIEKNGGATTSFLYEVHVERVGVPAVKSQTLASVYGSTRLNGESGVDLRWLNDNSLVIAYGEARSIDLKISSIDLADDDIDIKIQKGGAGP